MAMCPARRRGRNTEQRDDAVVEAETRSILKFAEEISGEELETYL